MSTATLDWLLEPLWGENSVPRHLAWSCQMLKYAQVMVVVFSFTISANPATVQLRSIMPYVGWISFSKADLAESQQLYSSAFYIACCWTALLGSAYAAVLLLPKLTR
jgi:hypothetical protein